MVLTELEAFKMDQLLPVLLYIKSYRPRPYSHTHHVAAEARLAARRAARAEAREIRMKELEKQQKETSVARTGSRASSYANSSEEHNDVKDLKADERSDMHFTLLRDPVQSVRQTSVTRSGSHGSSYASSRRSSEDSIEMDGRELKTSVTRSGSHASSSSSSSASSSSSSSRRSSADRNETDGKEVKTSVARTGSRASSYANSRRNSEELNEIDVRDLKHQVSDLEEKFRKAMINNAQMDNEKSALSYQVDLMKDEMEEMEENYLELQREHKEKCRDFDRTKRECGKMKEENNFLKQQIELRDKLIEEHGLVLLTEENEVEEDEDEEVGETKIKPKVALVTQEAAQLLEQAGEGSLDVRLKRFAEEKQDLLDEIQRLKLDLEEEKQKNLKIEKLVTQGPTVNGPDMKLLEIQREASKQVSDCKFKLQKAEQEIITLQGNIARLETQVSRYKNAADMSEKLEDELKAEKRKLQRELREGQSRIEELENANSHLQKRIDKLKSVRNTLVK